MNGHISSYRTQDQTPQELENIIGWAQNNFMTINLTKPGSCVICAPLSWYIGRHTNRRSNRYIGRYVNQHVTNILVNISTDTWPINQQRYVSRHIDWYIGQVSFNRLPTFCRYFTDTWVLVDCSLRCRRNLTKVSNICWAEQIYLLCPPLFRGFFIIIVTSVYRLNWCSLFRPRIMI